MPKGAKVLKDLLSHKQKLKKAASSVKLSEECSTFVQGSSPKRKETQRVSHYHVLSDLLKNALANLRASINLMPHFLFPRLGIYELKPTKMSIQLADRSVKYPIGICENLLVKVSKFIFSVDFVVLEMDEDELVPIILRRPVTPSISQQRNEIPLGCDHDGEFDNRNLHKLFADNGIQFRFSCPQTSQQNEYRGAMERRATVLPRFAKKSTSSWLKGALQAYNALIKHNTWTLVLRPTDTNIVCCMWLFRHKYHYDSCPSRHKARLVANGSTQLEGVDVDEAFSLNAFLHGDLSETVYMHQPLGSLNYFLGISITRDSLGMFLSQRKYAVEILERAGMVDCNLGRTPVDTESMLGHTVQQVCLHMHDPREPHLSALKRIPRYVREAEYRGVANVVAETYWLRNLLRELHNPLSSATLVYRDNVSAVYLSCNPVQHQRTEDIEIDIHFV
nr:hypothetical protein [Tanacetum cinerariifolium]